MTLAPLVALLIFAAPENGLERGIQLFNDFEDASAEVALRRFLEQQPTADDAAKAHLYLGLIAFNARDNARARKEFAEAVRIAPAVEAPFGASPKARYLFEEAQKETLATSPPTPRPSPRPTATPPPTPAPAPLPAETGGTGVIEVPSSGSPSRAPAYIIGGLGVAGLVAGGIFGGIAASELSIASSSRSGITTAINANNQAGPEGLTADILFAAGGALAITGIVLWFIEAPSSPETTAVILPVPQGAMLQIGHSF